MEAELVALDRHDQDPEEVVAVTLEARPRVVVVQGGGEHALTRRRVQHRRDGRVEGGRIRVEQVDPGGVGHPRTLRSPAFVGADPPHGWIRAHKAVRQVATSGAGLALLEDDGRESLPRELPGVF